MTCEQLLSVDYRKECDLLLLIDETDHIEFSFILLLILILWMLIMLSNSITFSVQLIVAQWTALID